MVEYDFPTILIAVLFFTIVAYLATHMLSNLNAAAKLGVPAVLLAASAASTNVIKDEEEEDADVDVDDVSASALTSDVGVSGGKDSIDVNSVKIVPHTERYNVYEDVNTLEEEDKKLLKKVKNIVIDGNNFLYFLKEISPNKEGKTYMKHLEHAIKKAVSVFPKKDIFFVMKDPNNEYQMKQALEDMGFDATADYRTSFKEYSEKIVTKYPKVRIVVAYGESKARDDFAAVYLAELLNNSILLSRDLYRDVDKTAGTDMNKTTLVTYGKSHKKFDLLMKSKALPNIGKWSLADKLVGFARIKSGNTSLYKTKNNGRVLLIRL